MKFLKNLDLKYNFLITFTQDQHFKEAKSNNFAQLFI